MTVVHKRLDAIHQRIENACLACGRSSSDVQLLLATKTTPPERIIEAFRLGETLIGENRVQELIAKAGGLAAWPVEKHMIGHLQSNKAAKALNHVSCIQSIDRISIARHLNRLLERRGKKIDIFLQFNTSGESSKFGARPEDAVSFTHQVAQLKNLRIRGLMTFGLLVPEPVLCRDSLKLLRILRDRIMGERIYNVELNELSMGNGETVLNVDGSGANATSADAV